MKRKIIAISLVIVIIIAAGWFYFCKFFHPRQVSRIVVEFDGRQTEASASELTEILNDFNNSIKFSDKSSEPWTCGVDENLYCVYLYFNDELIYKFAPVLDGCSSFDCVYNAYGKTDFFISCDKAKRIADILTGNPNYISRWT